MLGGARQLKMLKYVHSIIHVVSRAKKVLNLIVDIRLLGYDTLRCF